MERVSASVQAKIMDRPTKTFVRTAPMSWETHIPKNHIRRPDVVAPPSFDGRKIWRTMLSPVRNQGSCGACWSFATTSTLADRFNILSRGLLSLELSAAKLILCDQAGHEFSIAHPEEHPREIEELQRELLADTACYGSSLADAWRYLYLIGTNTEGCVPYHKGYGKFKEIKGLGDFSAPQELPDCAQVSGIFGDMCSDFSYNISTGEELGTPARFYRCKHFYAIAGTSKDSGSEYEIRHNIYLLGPVSTAIIIYPDFYTFDAKNDIYRWNGKGPVVGGHALEIVGWGKEDNVKYWIIKNSWGTNWGDAGYFRMVRGENECEIEDNVITGIPDFFTREDISDLYAWGDSNFEVQRQWIDEDITATAGGIDPETGYTRRIMAQRPGLDFTRELPLDKLPNFKSFIAGVNGSYEKTSASRGEPLRNSGTPGRSGSTPIFTIFLIAVVVLVTLGSVFGILFLVRRNKKV